MHLWLRQNPKNICVIHCMVSSSDILYFHFLIDSFMVLCGFNLSIVIAGLFTNLFTNAMMVTDDNSCLTTLAANVSSSILFTCFGKKNKEHNLKN